MPINIVTVCGSVRPGNYTGKALNLVDEVFAADDEVSLTRIDLADITLPLQHQGEGDDSTQRLRDAVSEATGVVLATPEYHGGFSAAMKLAIENLAFPSALGGKPVALLGVAAGVIGAIKSLEQLRSVCSHVGAVVLPGPVSVAGVNRVFDEDGNCVDERAGKRIRGCATGMLDYIRQSICPRMALEAMVRESD